MLIIGCDFRTRCQQIAMANDETGELPLQNPDVRVPYPFRGSERVGQSAYQ
jgi:hypothetical protein